MTLTGAPKLVAAAIALLAVGVFAGIQIGRSDRPVKKYPTPNPTVTQRLAEPKFQEEAQPIEDRGTFEDPGYYDEDQGYEEEVPEYDQNEYGDDGSSAVCPDCGNSGYRNCFSCDGTGMVDNSGTRSIAGLGQPGPPDAVCSTCGGSGRQRCQLH